MKGWIKVYRQLLSSHIFQNEKLLKIWIWSLLKASHTGKRQIVGRQKVELKVGQFITGRHAAAAELGMAPSTVWDYLKLLEREGCINIKSSNKFSIVTIVNWDFYQSQDEKTDNKTDIKKTTRWQQKNTSKKNNNGKNDYSSIFDFYLSLGLIKHRAYTADMANAIKKAITSNKYNVEYCKVLLERHKKVVELTRNTDYPVKARGLAEFFGQKVYGASHLICADYDVGGKFYEQFIKPKQDDKSIENPVDKYRRMLEGK